jgi:hypothetical protein
MDDNFKKYESDMTCSGIMSVQGFMKICSLCTISEEENKGSADKRMPNYASPK